MKPGDKVFLKRGKSYRSLTVTGVTKCTSTTVLQLSDGWIRSAGEVLTQEQFNTVQKERAEYRNEQAKARRAKSAARRFSSIVLAHKDGARTYQEFASKLHTTPRKIVSKVRHAALRGLIALDLEKAKAA